MATKTFEVTVRKPNNKILTKRIEASNKAEAERMARSEGIIISSKSVFRNTLFEDRMSYGDRQIFMTRLAGMVASRMSSGEALNLMNIHFTGAVRKVAGTMRKLVESGDDIGSAMEKVGPPNFPGPVIAMVRQGIKGGGDTAAALRSAVEFEQEMERVKRESGKGIYSGLASFVMALGMILVTTQYMAPQLLGSDIMKMGKGKINIDWAHVLAAWSTYLAVFLLIAITILGLVGTVGRLALPEKTDKLISKIPFYKDLVLAKNAYSTIHALSLMVTSGVSMEHAIRLTAETAPRGRLRNDLFRAHAAVKNGRPWAYEMKSLHPTDIAALSISLDKEQIAASLRETAVQYRTLYAQRIGTMAPAIQAVAALFLLLSGVIMFGLLILPMLQLAANGL